MPIEMIKKEGDFVLTSGSGAVAIRFRMEEDGMIILDERNGAKFYTTDADAAELNSWLTRQLSEAL
jgi:hypothetical protein